MIKLNKKSVKIISAVMILFVLLTSFSGVFAADTSTPPSPSATVELNGMDTIASKVLGIIQYVGMAIAVGMLMYLGIKYMTSSPDGKADIKGKLGVYVLGFVILVAATTIVTAIKSAIPQ